jgi:hypothetical protein
MEEEGEEKYRKVGETPGPVWHGGRVWAIAKDVE